MGEVYLAQDRELERTVALKILPAEMAADQQRMQRFIQEARAISALNHPHIITIYEIGQAASAPFIATEFIDGVTLREYMAGSRMKLSEVLEMVMQVASALASAHHAGIVHRDIKPENIMIRPDGYIKVLDFGLAKLTEQKGSNAQAQTIVETEPGLVMGTPNYMSPEQARGLAMDARTDIWSLGCVLYEMVAGQKPFGGSTASDIIVSILEKEPPRLTRDAGEIPPEFERIVAKALAKDREERYQTIKDLLIDLKRLKQRLEVEAEVGHLVASNISNISSGAMTAGGSVQTRAPTADREAVRDTNVEAARTTSSVEYLVSEISRHKSGAALALVAVTVMVAGIIWGLTKFFNPHKPAAAFQTMKIARVTSSGKATDATISPDGKYVVYVEDDGGRQSLWVRHVATSSNVQIVAPAEAWYGDLSFSPDGNHIYYLRAEKNDPIGVLYQIPVLGGAPRKLIANVESAITFSPDGKRIAFVRRNPDQGEYALVVANANGTGEQQLAARKFPALFLYPAWSPDGNVVACSTKSQDMGGRFMSVIEVSVESGAEKPITSHRWWQVGRICWLSDGGGLVMIAADQASSPAQVWQLSYPGGEARRVTNDLNNYVGMSLTADSKALVTVQQDQLSSIWVAPNGDTNRAKQITSGGGRVDGANGLCWSSSGKIVYTSSESGTSDIWIMEADGTGQRQLTSDGSSNLYPSVSPDDRSVVFVSNRTGSAHIWSMDLDGYNTKQLTNSPVGEAFPTYSPDGRWIVYTSSVTGTQTLWKLPIDGDEPVQLIDRPSSEPAISPDGKRIACTYLNEQSNSDVVAIIPFAGGQPTKINDIPPTVNLLVPVRWTTDGRALSYVDTRVGVSNIWSISFEGGQPKQLTDFKAEQIFWFDWSRDGHQLACARGTVTNNVVLISDYK
jgi:serine/threonine protein kinase